MLTPGPDHPITVTPAKSRWRAKYGDHVIADTGDAMILKEADYPAVVYFPRADVSMDFFSRTDRTTLAVGKALQEKKREAQAMVRLIEGAAASGKGQLVDYKA